MPRAKATSNLPPLLFSVTLFVSAGLLFWIQPLIAKSLLPLLGGAPAVWNTCLLFFQSMLLLGYVYALASSRWLGVRSQAVLHVFLLLLIVVYVFRAPISAPVLNASQQGAPVRWLLENLLVSVGPPFFIISASNPLLQGWFAKLRHQLARDPYFLFAASNAGSLIALLAFPLVLEPNLGLNQQYRLWRVTFVVLVGLIGMVGLALKALSGNSNTASDLHETQSSVAETGSKPALLRRLRWLALSFVPSSLMIGVTTYITADVAAVPLLWVIPLALYLLTFVLAFSKRQFFSVASLDRPLIVAALVVTLILASGATEPAWLLILANLIFFCVAAMMCHGQLANDRPAVTHLAEYYLWIAAGGALGSVFNVLVAPVLFTSIVEYPLAIAIACMLRPGKIRTGANRYFDFIYPAALYLLTVGLALLITYLRPGTSIINLIIVLGVPLIIINHFFRERPVRFGLGLCAVMLASVYYAGFTDHKLYVVRNFFGTTRATTDSRSKINTLYSGNTVHGRQFADQSRRCEPLSYHHENGPLGQVMAVFNAAPANSRVAVIGLGVGAMAAYSRPDQEWTFYEINPDIINLARASRYFTYLRDCASGSMNVVEGDARLNLQNASAGRYGLIVLDAFSSDAIPVHLVTQQALDLYLAKLAPGGILAFHISNRSLNLKPILADLAKNRKLICIGFDDLKPSSLEGKDPSQWVVMTRSEPEIGNLTINSQWQRLHGTHGRVWSDDFSNILQAIKWQ